MHFPPSRSHGWPHGKRTAGRAPVAQTAARGLPRSYSAVLLIGSTDAAAGSRAADGHERSAYGLAADPPQPHGARHVAVLPSASARPCRTAAGLHSRYTAEIFCRCLCPTMIGFMLDPMCCDARSVTVRLLS